MRRGHAGVVRVGHRGARAVSGRSRAAQRQEGGRNGVVRGRRPVARSRPRRARASHDAVSPIARRDNRLRRVTRVRTPVARTANRVAGAPPRGGRAHKRDFRPAATPARARARVPGGSDGVLRARFGVARARAVLARAGSGTPLAFQPPRPVAGREVAPEQSYVTVAVRRPTTARPRVDGRVV